jgi:hypothetical protein
VIGDWIVEDSSRRALFLCHSLPLRIMYARVCIFAAARGDFVALRAFVRPIDSTNERNRK